MNDLTDRQKITNYETLKHIEQVMALLSVVQHDLSKRMFTHDRSKLVSPELEMFEEVTDDLSRLTYGSDEYRAQLGRMREGPLAHHYAMNRHHPEHFPNGIEGMNLMDVIEMICDWVAATQRHKDGSVEKSLEINEGRFGIEPQLMQVIRNTVPYLSNPYKEMINQDLMYDENRCNGV